MNLIKRGNIKKMQLPGRVIQQAVGTGKAVSPSSEMTMGFAFYSEASGPMEPHSHAEEIVYILGAQDGWARRHHLLLQYARYLLNELTPISAKCSSVHR